MELQQHIPFIKEMISKVKTAEFRKKWENILNLINSGQSIEKSQIDTINQTVVKAKELLTKFERKTTNPVAIAKVHFI